jgi:cytochrome c oxidase assembly protein subunit 15
VSAARRRFGAALAVATVGLVFAGAEVKSRQAGLSVPDWPLSYGQLWPRMVGNVFYEHGHRTIAATVGFLTLLLALWTARTESRRVVRRLAWTCLAAVVAQGLLGGLTVKLLLAARGVHRARAPRADLPCLMVALAFATSREGEAADAPGLTSVARTTDGGARARRATRLCALATGCVFVQLVLGALMRHTESGLAVPFFPTDARGALVPDVVTSKVAIHLAHRGFAFVVLAAVVAAAVGDGARAAAARRAGIAGGSARRGPGAARRQRDLDGAHRPVGERPARRLADPRVAARRDGRLAAGLVWLLALRTRRLGAGGTAESGTPRAST